MPMHKITVPTKVRHPTRWIALAEAAGRLGIRWDTVITYIKMGKLEGRLCAGRRWFVRADSLRDSSRRVA